jgi:hypothetical protein
MKSAMAAPSVEEHKSLDLQQRHNFSESDAIRGVAHLLKELVTPVHERSFLIRARDHTY